MKNYRITVNGNEYDVAVEEVGASTSTSAPKAAPKAAPKKAAKAAPKASAGAGSVKVSSPMPGKILSVKKNVGDSVSKGDTILVLEAMKMENDIVAPEDGTIASIDVNEGASVEAGAVLATLN
ncbi:MAG: biotin/lipoyl-binding protein [Lachnospiraceae bacterium]|nr:biotin/lipoyl-binding protein [Lachnospiraceae bacterium]MBQ5474429.1 biotin/lipoyl-binding protein [Lachnospiraceae bacterium]